MAAHVLPARKDGSRDGSDTRCGLCKYMLSRSGSGGSWLILYLRAEVEEGDLLLCACGELEEGREENGGG